MDDGILRCGMPDVSGNPVGIGASGMRVELAATFLSEVREVAAKMAEHLMNMKRSRPKTYSAIGSLAAARDGELSEFFFSFSEN
jgi:hypothetical protein